MIEQAESETYYYHYDGLGSVVALSDSAGDTVQTYEYSIYGQVAVEDINHPNPYMFAGRRFDIEIGLYYNRARYYNPYTGRFLQADPVGYEAGMNLYKYCHNNPVGLSDPFGLDPCDACEPDNTYAFVLDKRSGDFFRLYGDQWNVWQVLAFFSIDKEYLDYKGEYELGGYTGPLLIIDENAGTMVDREFYMNKGRDGDLLMINGKWVPPDVDDKIKHVEVPIIQGVVIVIGTAVAIRAPVVGIPIVAIGVIWIIWDYATTDLEAPMAQIHAVRWALENNLFLMEEGEFPDDSPSP